MTTATKKKAPSAVDLAARIDAEPNQLNVQVEEGHAYGFALAQELRRLGFKDRRSYSRCSVAGFEAHLQKGQVKVDVTSACFMGCFTEVRAWRSEA